MTEAPPSRVEWSDRLDPESFTASMKDAVARWLVVDQLGSLAFELGYGIHGARLVELGERRHLFIGAAVPPAVTLGRRIASGVADGDAQRVRLVGRELAEEAGWMGAARFTENPYAGQVIASSCGTAAAALGLDRQRECVREARQGFVAMLSGQVVEGMLSK